MSYAALVSLSYTIEQFLYHDQYSISDHRKQQIKSIHENVSFLQAFLEDVRKKVDGTLKERIRDVANQAEDVIEYFTWGQIQLSRHASNIRNKVQFEDDQKGNLCYDFSELDKVAEQIGSIAVEVKGIMDHSRFEDMKLSGSAVASSSSSRIVSINKKDGMVGFDDHLLAIKDRLFGEPKNLQVIPIVGMGGIGKTTLARNAFYHPSTMKYFDIHAWVTVSQAYNAQEILSSLLDSMKEFKSERCGQDNELKVHQTLKGRRYLIMIDDIWSTEAWDDVGRIFPDDNNGSRILLTTRLSDVAAYAGSSSRVHQMHLMHNDQSWNLLHYKVFTHEEACPIELENIGKEIAQSCGGLPLAIVVIGGILSTVSRTPSSWQEIAENVKSNVATQDDGQIGKVLSLSYTHLPHHLRLCLLYMGAFPEDYEIRVSELIKLWIAEGFIKSSVSGRSFEDEAEEYLEDLVKRSLLLVTKRKLNGKIKSCSIHDLVRDLCIEISKDEKFLHLIVKCEGQIPESVRYKRRVGIAHSNLNCISGIHGSSIRTLICCKCFTRPIFPVIECVNFRLIRILHILDAPTYDMPTTLFELFHLRYLGFHFVHINPLKSIPAAISNLQSLQTLIIHVSQYNVSNFAIPLPLETWRMPQLRHLVCFCLDPLPNQQGTSYRLENLQTLSTLVDFICTKQILEMIKNLKKLGISYSHSADGHIDYQLHNLVDLKRLETLKVVVSVNSPCRSMLRPVFPKTLKKLTLSRLQLCWEYMTVIGSLPNLQVLKLRNFAFKGYKWETNGGEFPELEYLLMDLSNLYEWITGSSHFPRLKSLLLHRTSLKEIPDGIAEIPTLELIEIKGTNESLVKSAKQIQEQQEEYGNDVLQFCFLT